MQIERELVQKSTQLRTPEEYQAWEEKCKKCLESLEERSRSSKRARLSTGVRQSLVSKIVRLEGLQISLRQRFIHFGGGGGGEHGNNSRSANGLVWREIETAFQNRILTGAVINTNYIDPRQFLKDAMCIVLKNVQQLLETHNSIKVNTIFNGEFIAGEKTANKSINTRNRELYRTSNIKEWFTQYIIESTLSSLEEFQERDSGWALSRIQDLTVNINKHNPLHAGCYLQLPREIMIKRAVITVQTQDNACFAWAIVAALYPAKKHVDRQSSYPHYTTVLNFQDIEFPMALKEIPKFEELNSISINIYAIREKDKKDTDDGLLIVPLRLTNKKRDKHVNLLYVADTQDNNVGHFACIQHLSRLVSSQLNKKKAKTHICDR